MTTHKDIVLALETLGAKEYSFSGNKISDIVWLSADTKSAAEIENALAYPLPDTTQAARAAAEAKLAALGLTPEDLKALGL